MKRRYPSWSDIACILIAVIAAAYLFTEASKSLWP